MNITVEKKITKNRPIENKIANTFKVCFDIDKVCTTQTIWCKYYDDKWVSGCYDMAMHTLAVCHTHNRCTENRLNVFRQRKTN